MLMVHYYDYRVPGKEDCSARLNLTAIHLPRGGANVEVRVELHESIRNSVL